MHTPQATSGHHHSPVTRQQHTSKVQQTPVLYCSTQCLTRQRWNDARCTSHQNDSWPNSQGEMSSGCVLDRSGGIWRRAAHRRLAGCRRPVGTCDERYHAA
ncbi:hypothetical protein E2C01_046976 [Portunus trituberculatus]|uniref:Uncharacterized protein n=1 Tax=Portunus trituberculatus TaxID=210409 RepID=A0A5B7G2D6_PORTR|nr:hypothetical protein [Portunus trituberculatus]